MSFTEMNFRGCQKSFTWVEAYDEIFGNHFLYTEQTAARQSFSGKLANHLRALNLGGESGTSFYPIFPGGVLNLH